MKYLALFLLLVLACAPAFPDRSWEPRLNNLVSFSDEFSQEEKGAIIFAFNVWDRETNCSVSFVESPDASIQIVKATDEEMKGYDLKKHRTVIGIAELDNDPRIFFMFQRIRSLEELELVAAHEAGHHLGMEHIPQEQTSIMNPAVNNLLLNHTHLSQYDIDQFNNHWGCK